MFTIKIQLRILYIFILIYPYDLINWLKYRNYILRYMSKILNQSRSFQIFHQGICIFSLLFQNLILIFQYWWKFKMALFVWVIILFILFGAVGSAWGVPDSWLGQTVIGFSFCILWIHRFQLLWTSDAGWCRILLFLISVLRGGANAWLCFHGCVTALSILFLLDSTHRCSWIWGLQLVSRARHRSRLQYYTVKVFAVFNVISYIIDHVFTNFICFL